MAIRDLDPYTAGGLKAFGSRTLNAMDASTNIPRVDDNYAGVGVSQLNNSVADSVALNQRLASQPNIRQPSMNFDDIANQELAQTQLLGESLAPQMQQPPSVGFNKATNQVFVNGLTFDADDYQTAIASDSPKYLNRTPTGLPDGFEQLSPDAYNNYINSIRDPGKLRLMGKNFGIGVDNLQNFFYAGTALAGDAFDSEGLSRFGREGIERQKEDLRRTQPFNKTFTEDVLKEGQLVNWFLANLAQQGPNLIESMLVFLGGAAAGSVAQGNPLSGFMTGVAASLGKKQVIKRMMDIVAKKKRGEALDAGEQALARGMAGIGAAIANNYRTGVSDTYLELLESAEMKNPGTEARIAALIAGLPYAAAETVAEAFVVSKFLNPTAASNAFKRITKAFMGGAVAEGAAEGVQETSVLTADALVNDKEFFTEENGKRLLNSIAAGAAVGGPISGLSGFRGGNQEVDMLDNQQPPPTGTSIVPFEGRFTLGEGTAPQGPYRPDFTMEGGVYDGTRAGAITPFVGETTRMETESTTPILPGYTGAAVISDVNPDFTASTDGTIDPNNQQFDILNQPVRVEGGFIPGTEQQPQGALNVTPNVTTRNEINQILGDRPVQEEQRVVTDSTPDPNQMELPLGPPTPRQLPLPMNLPRQKPPAQPLTQDEVVTPPPMNTLTADQIEDIAQGGPIAGTPEAIQQDQMRDDMEQEARDTNNVEALKNLYKEDVDALSFPLGPVKGAAARAKFAKLKTIKAVDNFYDKLGKQSDKANEEASKPVPAPVKKKVNLKKGKKDAVQKPEATQVDAQEQAKVSETVGKEVQETSRTRTKKEVLKKEEVKEQSVQVSKKPKTKLDTLKRGVTKSVVAKPAAPKPTTVNQQPVETQDPVKRWDENKPDPSSPSLDNPIFTPTEVGMLKRLNAVQMQKIWTNEGIDNYSNNPNLQVTLLGDALVSNTGIDLQENIISLMQIGLPKKSVSGIGQRVQQRAQNLLLDTALPESQIGVVKEAIIDTTIDLIINKSVEFSGNPTWFKLAERYGVVQAIDAKLRGEDSVANFRKVANILVTKQDRAKQDVIANEEALKDMPIAMSIYTDPKTGPTAQANRIADKIATLPKVIKSRDNPTVQTIERLTAGLGNVKPDMEMHLNGVPLRNYFTDNRKLKLVDRQDGFVVDTTTVSVARRKERELREKLGVQTTTTKDEKGETVVKKSLKVKDKKLEEKLKAEQEAAKKRIAARKEQDALDSGYGERRSVIDELNDPNGNFRRYEDDKPTTPMDVGRAKLLVKSIVSKFAVKPNVKVVRNAVELQNKFPELYNKIIKDRPNFAQVPASGYSIGSDVIIFTDFIKSEGHLKFTIAHEAMGHFGLRSLVSKSELKGTLELIYNTSSHIRDVADANMELYSMDKLEAIEEALADHVAYVEHSALEKVWNLVKKFLRKIGLNFETDGAAYYVNQLRRYIRNGEIIGTVSPEQIAKNIEALNQSEVGRFAVHRAEFPDGLNIHSGPKEATFTTYFTRKRSKFTEILEKGLDQLQTLDNAKKFSYGLQMMFEVFRKQAATAKSILSYLDGLTSTATKPRWFGLNKNALTDSERQKVSDLLAYGNAKFAQSLNDSDLRNLPDPVTVTADGDATINEDALDLALDEYTLTSAEIANGFDYLEGGVKKDTFKIEGFDPENNARDGLIFKAYLEQRKAINYAAARVALGKFKAAQKLSEGNIQNFRNITSAINDADLDVFREIRTAFTNIYQSAGQTASGRYHPDVNTIRNAEAFLNGVTRALWQDGALADLEAMTPSDDAEGKMTAKAIEVINNWNEANPTRQINMANLTAGLRRMRAYNIKRDVVMDKIQQPLKNQVFTDTQLLNANAFAKQTMFESYVKFKRRGDHQLRFQAYEVKFNPDGTIKVDDNGNPVLGEPVKLYESWASAFPYYQNDRAVLKEMQKDYFAELRTTTFKIPTTENPDGQKVEVVMIPIVESASAGTPSNQSLNYDEFASILNTLGINLDLAERERIVLALSKQHDKARGSLKKEFTPGFDKDMFTSTAEWLETAAAVAAKNEHRTDIDLIMNNKEYWFGDIKKIKRLRDKMHKAQDDYNNGTGTLEALQIAREEFDVYALAYKYSAGEGTEVISYRDKNGKEQKLVPLGRGNEYKDSSAQLLQFYAQQTDIAVSAEDYMQKGPLATAKSAAVLMQLGGSIATGLINLTSLPLMAAPLLATYNPKTGIGGGYGAQAATSELIRAAKNLGGKNWGDPNWILDNVLKNNNHRTYGLTKDEAQFLWRETSRGVLDAALVNSLVGTARGNFFKNGTATEASKLYMTVFAYTEQLNRRTTALAAYRLEKRRRMAADPTLQDSDFLLQEDLIETVPAEKEALQAVESKVVEMVNKSQGDYAMYNRPKLFRTGWAQYIYMYKQFTVIATQLARNLSPKGRLFYLTALVAMSGLKGLPFAEDLADVIDTVAQLFNLKVPPAELALAKVVEDIQPGASKYVLRGGLDGLFFGGTISTRIGLGDLIPGSGIFLQGSSTPQELKNIAGPIYSAFAGGVVTAVDTLKLPFKADIKGEAIRVAQASPIALLRNIGDTAMYNATGSIVNSRGYTVTKDVGEGTLLSRMLGFYPADATRSNDAIRITKRLVDNQKAIVSGYREQYVGAYLRKDRAAMRDVLSAVREHNRAYRRGSPFYIDNFNGKVKRAVKLARIGAGERFLKTTPKSTRDSITKYIEDYYGVSLN